jgi:phytanoyl-CoA hydroxylase
MASTVDTAAVRVLSADEVAAYHRDGFLIVRGLYDGEEMLDWKRVIQDVLEQERKQAGDDQWNLVQSGVRVWMADVIHPRLREAMRDNHVVPILQQLVGPDLEFLSAKAVFKNDKTAFPSPWHQDWFYWEGAPKMSIWIALDDATPANGCLKLVPGSHKRVFNKKVVEGNAFVNRIDDKDLEGLPVVTGEVKRGDAVFFHDLAVHSSYPNTTGADRWSVISTYRNAAVKDEATVWKTGMLISGRSANGAVRM